MKSKKILLLALVVMLVLSLVACKPAQEQQENAPDCFLFEDEKYPNDILQLEGDIVAKNREYNLVAFANDEPYGGGSSSMRRVIEIYDLVTREVVAVYNSTLYADGREAVKVDLNYYPIVKFTEQKSDGDDGFEDVYSFYLLTGDKDTFRQLANGEDNADLNSNVVGNMFLCRINEDFYWINKDLEVVRTETYLAADSSRDNNWEDYFNFFAEYCNYVYAMEYSQTSQMVIVYDPNGVASAVYNFTPGISVMQYANGDFAESIINPKVFVMDDGNVLIQEFLILDKDAEEYDLIYQGNTKLELITKVMNYKTGEVKNLDVDFVISDFESHYDGEFNTNSFPFKLAPGYNNQAYIIKLENGQLARTVDYVVLDNSLEVKYTFKNDYLANNYYGIYDADEEGYYADYFCEGKYLEGYFNYDGELIHNLPDNTYDNGKTHYVTYNGIYSYADGLVLDFVAEYNGLVEAGYIGDSKIMIMSISFVTEKANLEIFDCETGSITLLHEELDLSDEPIDFTDDLLLVYDSEKLTISAYNENAEKILVVSADSADLISFSDAIIVSAIVDGETVYYVPGYKAAE